MGAWTTGAADAFVSGTPDLISTQIRRTKTSNTYVALYENEFINFPFHESLG
jgi:hypothetical protein